MWVRHLFALSILIAFSYVSVFWYAPEYYPLDYSIGLPLMAELREAWVKYGIIDFDFSPYRCLGLPAFSGPTSLTWSVYHLTALMLPEFAGLCAALMFFSVISYLFCVLFLEEAGLDRRWQAPLALGWVLQGALVARALASHTNFYVFGLVPLFMYLLIRKRFSWSLLAASGFIFAHSVYTTAPYLPPIIGLGLIVATAALRWVDRDGLLPRLSWGRLFGFFAALTVAAGAMSFAKLAGVFNFSALFPREVSLMDVNFTTAVSVAAAHVFLPFPWDPKAFAGWWYGNWETYQYLYPGLIFAVIALFFKNGWTRARMKWIATIALLILLGAVMISGMWSPVARALPVLKSMHVNPRWSMIMIPALFLLYVWAVKNLEWKLKPIAEIAVWILFVVTPFTFIDQKAMAIDFVGERAISREAGRALYCYEPMFGYQLELFPPAKAFNPMSARMVDPRCYLKSHACEPGSPFPATNEGDQDNQRLLRYELKDTYGPVMYGKYPSLFLYGLGFLALIYHAALAARLLLKRSE